MQLRHTSANDFRVKKVLSKIGYDPALSVKVLAKLVKLSSSRLGHLFKAETGVELRHFLVDSRLEKAAQLLLDTDLQIKKSATPSAIATCRVSTAFSEGSS